MRSIGAAAEGSDRLAALRTAVDALVAQDPADLGDQTRLGRLRELWPTICALQAYLVALVGAVHGSGGATDDGFVSTASFLRRRLRLDAARASMLVRVGRRGGELAASTEASRAGEISVEHVDAIGDVVEDVAEVARANGVATSEVERVLLDQARVCPPADVRRLGRLMKVRLLGEERATVRQARLYT
jgi:hypothetical protein